MRPDCRTEKIMTYDYRKSGVKILCGCILRGPADAVDIITDKIDEVERNSEVYYSLRQARRHAHEAQIATLRNEKSTSSEKLILSN
jgi:hypothetical protein